MLPAIKQILTHPPITAAMASGSAWDPSHKASNITLSNSNLTALVDNSVIGCVYGTQGYLGGGAGSKRYFEGTINDFSGGNGSIDFCIGDVAAGTGVTPGASGATYGYYDTGGGAYIVVGGSPAATGADFPGAGAILHIAADFGAQLLWAGCNGTWMTSVITGLPGNPAAGTNAVAMVAGTFYPILGIAGGTGSKLTLNTNGTMTYKPSGFSNWS